MFILRFVFFYNNKFNNKRVYCGAIEICCAANDVDEINDKITG